MKKMYTTMDIRLSYLEEEDVITYSAGELDSEKENDLTSDDIFAD